MVLARRRLPSPVPLTHAPRRLRECAVPAATGRGGAGALACGGGDGHACRQRCLTVAIDRHACRQWCLSTTDYTQGEVTCGAAEGTGDGDARPVRGVGLRWGTATTYGFIRLTYPTVAKSTLPDAASAFSAVTLSFSV